MTTFTMTAKYDGYCRATNQAIIAGKTLIAKINGRWQVAQDSTPKTGTVKPAGAVMSVAWSESVQDRWGDEYLKHYACFADEEGEIIGKSWSFGTHKKAIYFAEALMDEHKLEDCLNETMW